MALATFLKLSFNLLFLYDILKGGVEVIGCFFFFSFSRWVVNLLYAVFEQAGVSWILGCCRNNAHKTAVQLCFIHYNNKHIGEVAE